MIYSAGNKPEALYNPSSSCLTSSFLNLIYTPEHVISMKITFFFFLLGFARSTVKPDWDVKYAQQVTVQCLLSLVVFLLNLNRNMESDSAFNDISEAWLNRSLMEQYF